MNAPTRQDDYRSPVTMAATRYADVWLKDPMVQAYSILAARLLAYRAWRVRLTASRCLHRFDDALLKDIGLCRGEIDSRLRELDDQSPHSLRVKR